MDQSKDRYIDGKLVYSEFGFCETCGERRRVANAKLCDGCWEVEHRLADYLRSGLDNARKFVAEALAKADREEVRRALIAAVQECLLTEEDMNMDNDSPQRHQEAIKDAIDAMRAVKL